jgi:hypothetical protein
VGSIAGTYVKTINRGQPRRRGCRLRIAVPPATVLRKVLPEELDHQSAEDVAGESTASQTSSHDAAVGNSSPAEAEEWHVSGIESSVAGRWSQPVAIPRK